MRAGLGTRCSAQHLLLSTWSSIPAMANMLCAVPSHSPPPNNPLAGDHSPAPSWRQGVQGVCKGAVPGAPAGHVKQVPHTCNAAVVVLLAKLVGAYLLVVFNNCCSDGDA